MGQSTTTARLKFNPIEVAVFTLVSAVFLHSLYQLFYDWEEVKTQAAGTADIQMLTANSRALSSTPVFDSIDFSCEDTQGKNAPTTETHAAKIRLGGPLCPMAEVKSENEKNTPSKVEVVNKTTKSEATIIRNDNENHFWTDLISIAAGKNQIQIRFIYSNGIESTHNLIVQKI